MATCVRPLALRDSSPQHSSSSQARSSEPERDRAAGPASALSQCTEPKTRVLVAVENRLLREALSRMLAKDEKTEVIDVGNGSSAPHADVLLLGSRGSLEADLLAIQQFRADHPSTRILLIGMTADSAEFLQCVRAGVSGYLLRDASAEEVLGGVRAVAAGNSVCPESLCAVLFRYFASEASDLPVGSVRHRLGFTRREQQLIPLIAQGLTNKEIANRFSLSEQTVKNHLHRMKHKIGAEDRLDIVHLYRVQGFLV
jgi:DNA-binding NarL/FixJ family response regulator